MRVTARDYLIALRDSYIETSEKSSASDEHRASVVIPSTGECFHTDSDTADTILCTTKYGKSDRDNVTGMHPVRLHKETGVVYIKV